MLPDRQSGDDMLTFFQKTSEQPDASQGHSPVGLPTAHDFQAGDEPLTQHLMSPERVRAREVMERIKSTDPELAGIMEKLLAEKTKARTAGLEGGLEAMRVDDGSALETIVREVGRPSLIIQDDDYKDTDKQLQVQGSEIWKKRLFQEEVKASILDVIPAVGRVELEGHPYYTWVGTAWLVDEDIAVTNWHVADEFAKRNGQGFTYRPGEGGKDMLARVDFRQEHERSEKRLFTVKDILYIADNGAPDMALLKLERKDGSGAALKGRLKLSKEKAKPNDFVVTIGYPAADSRVLDQSLVTKFFGEVFNKKRLAPGQIIDQTEELLRHDCSTLGGASGSPVMDMRTGKVYGLHFSGVYLKENRAVSALVVADILDKVKRSVIPVSSGEVKQTTSALAPQTPQGAGGGDRADGAKPGGGQVVRFNLQIPVELSLALGQPNVGGDGVANGAVQVVGTSSTVASPSSSVKEAVAQVRAMVGQNEGVLEVREGFAFENGWITKKPAVVVALRESPARASVQVPRTVLDIPVEVRDPGVAELMPHNYNLLEEGVRETVYEPPKDFKLEEVNQEMKVNCHLSPDAGWPVLSGFLEETSERLTMGIYDFTAPHVVNKMIEVVKDKPKTFTLVMQEGESMKEGEGIKGEDWREKKVIQKFRDALGKERFQHVAASVGKGMQFASSYHIKVIVRDGKAIWLSSGNLQSSNQYKEAPEENSTDWWHLDNLNREWNVVIENEALATQFENFLLYDFEKAAAREAPPEPVELFDVEELPELERVHAGAASYAPPLKRERKVKVMPLLTPDNYQKRVLKLLQGAEEQILFQNQSLNLQGVDNQGNDKNDPRFAKLYETLLKKQEEGVDIRIIMRGDFNPETYLERLQALGFDMKRIRLQSHLHTKGIVVDKKKVLVGSHNWTNEGTLANRDASLIFDDEEIAQYYAKAFWFDWKNLAKPSVGPARRVRRAGRADREVPIVQGWERVAATDLW